jgi:hypothetical protein
MIFRRHVIPGVHKSPSIAKKMGTAAASVLLAKQLTLRWNFEFHWFGAVGIVILGLVDLSAHRVPAHRTRVRREQPQCAFRTLRRGIEPEIVVVGSQDCRHSIVDVGQESIWGGRQDRTALDDLSSWIGPPVPQPGESEYLPILHLEAVGLFAFPILHPLVKPVGRNQAALGLEGFRKRRCGRHGFGSRTDRPKANGRALRPRGESSLFCWRVPLS